MFSFILLKEYLYRNKILVLTQQRSNTTLKVVVVCDLVNSELSFFLMFFILNFFLLNDSQFLFVELNWMANPSNGRWDIQVLHRLHEHGSLPVSKKIQLFSENLMNEPL